MQSSEGAEGERIRKDRRVLLWATLLSGAFAGTEVAGAYLSGSLSLLGEALHLASDFAGYLVGIMGLTLSLRPPSAHMTFGYDRAESLAALASLVLIWVMCCELIRGAVLRLLSPTIVHAGPMLIVASIGLCGNIL